MTVLERQIGTSRLPAGTGDQVMRRMRILPRDEHPFFNDPDGWAQEQLHVESWSKPQAIRESVRDNRHTAVPAAHDVAKSHTAASLACWWLETRPIGEAMVVSTAPRQHQVDSILWREIRQMHRTGGLSGRVLPGTARWYMGNDELVGFGRKTADEVDPEQAMQAFQGIHARYVLVIIDEAGGVPKWLFDAADSLAANEHSRVLAIGNPDDPASHFAEICKPGTKWNVLPVSAFDSPRYTGEEVSERLLELLVSDLYVQEMADLGEDSNLYQSKVLGQFPDVSDDALFPPRLLQRAIDQDLPGLGLGGYGVDVARYGADETCVYRNRDGVIRLVEAARKQDTEDTADMVEAILAGHGPDRVAAAIDAVGIGAGVYDKLRRRGMPVSEFNAGARALEPHRFVNKRAEMFWTLRTWIEDGLVDLDPDDKQLLSQLGRMKFKQVAGNRIQIESKDDMRKRGVKSPDRADAAAMTLMAPPALRADMFADAAAPGETLTGDLMERAM